MTLFVIHISVECVQYREAIEIFHLIFLRAFGGRVDKALFAVKGGCNLRFFHKSIRYSEDMDLDIQTMSVETLRSNIERIFGTESFAQSLRTQQIQLVRFTSPKQTSTTQRWKIRLRLVDSGNEIPTKIEFSRRSLEPGSVHEAVDAEIITRYRLYPVLVRHYSAATALEQKVRALALRSETQARDVFDLKLLIDSKAGPQALRKDVAAKLPRAIENALSIDFAAYAGQVVAYLEPEYQSHFGERRVWNALQKQVVDALGALQS